MVITVGAERPLEIGDVYPLPARDSPTLLVQQMEAEWKVLKDRGPSPWYLVRPPTNLRCLLKIWS